MNIVQLALNLIRQSIKYSTTGGLVHNFLAFALLTGLRGIKLIILVAMHFILGDLHHDEQLLPVADLLLTAQDVLGSRYRIAPTI